MTDKNLFAELSRGLSERQIKFAVACAENPSLPRAEIARRVGFAKKSAAVSACLNFHNVKVRALIRHVSASNG